MTLKPGDACTVVATAGTTRVLRVEGCDATSVRFRVRGRFRWKTTFVAFALADEAVSWLRGAPAPGSEAVRALLAANALAGPASPPIQAHNDDLQWLERQ